MIFGVSVQRRVKRSHPFPSQTILFFWWQCSAPRAPCHCFWIPVLFAPKTRKDSQQIVFTPPAAQLGESCSTPGSLWSLLRAQQTLPSSCPELFCTAVPTPGLSFCVPIPCAAQGAALILPQTPVCSLSLSNETPNWH